jgi:hypothetical protein
MRAEPKSGLGSMGDGVEIGTRNADVDKVNVLVLVLLLQRILDPKDIALVSGVAPIPTASLAPTAK